MKKIKFFLINLNIIKGDFEGQAFVYLDKNNNVVSYPTDKVKWLENLKVHCYKKEEDNHLFDLAHKRYPEYIGNIYIF